MKIKEIQLILFFAIVIIFVPTLIKASYGCSDYGMAYEDFSGYCKCMSGYVWGKNIMGDPYCISADQACKDEYGYNATSDYLTNKCKCRYGYVFADDMFGNLKCTDADSVCRDKIGYNSRYNSLEDKCECNSGYELSYKSFDSGLECKSCFMKYGLHSSYNYLLDKCECDDDYTLVDNKCVEKHNSAYFLLKEINIDNKEAIVRSNYSGSCYYIKYGVGCYDATIRRYINHDIVINMGTDLYVDAWDWLVLQDDDEECNITKVNNVSCSFSLDDNSDSNPVYIPNIVINNLKTCGSNSYLNTENKCQCNNGYQWVDYTDINNLNCELISSNNNSGQSGAVLGINTVSDFVNQEKKLLGNVDSKLANRLKGKILLQVENNGEAWYVHPVSLKRYYMANGNEAYKIMRELGVGITNQDLEKVQNDKNFAKKHSGKIFLQVEANGEAYYIDFDGNAHYLKDGNEAYDIMRDLGLGITNNDLRKIDIN